MSCVLALALVSFLPLLLLARDELGSPVDCLLEPAPLARVEIGSDGLALVPAAEVNPNQHYLGNRARKKGVVEKCTFCIHRTREGRLPACAEACPTGARVFGNLLDPDSEIRWVLENKQVFRLKEDLKTEPRFWYFTD